jgi:hypothetical protein
LGLIGLPLTSALSGRSDGRLGSDTRGRLLNPIDGEDAVTIRVFPDLT